VRPIAKVTIDSLQEVVYEKSYHTDYNMTQIQAISLEPNISENS